MRTAYRASSSKMNCVIAEFVFQSTILVARAGCLLIHEEIGSWHNTKLTTVELLNPFNKLTYQI